MDGSKNEKGEENKENPFTRKDTIQRTPPRPRAFSLPRFEGYSRVECLGSDEEQSTKRKRTEEVPDKQMDKGIAAQLEAVLVSIHEQAKRLEKVLGEMYKPKQELKDISNKLMLHTESFQFVDFKKWVGQVTSENMALKDENLALIKRTDYLEAEHRAQKESGKTQCEGCKQAQLVENDGSKNESEKRERERRRKIRELLNKNMIAEELVEVINQKWPETAFEKVKETTSSILAPEVKDRLIFIDTVEHMESALVKRLIYQHPHLNGLLSSGSLQTSQVICNKNYSQIEIGEEKTITEQYTFVVGYKDEPLEAFIKNMKGAIGKVKEKIDDRNKLSVTITGEKSQEHLRKLLEYEFKNEEIEIDFHVKKKKEEEKGKNRESGDWQRKGETQVVEVKITEGTQRTYAEMMREVRKQVNIEELGIKVQRVYKTKDGNARIKISGSNDGDGAKIKKAIEEKMTGTVSAELVRKNKTVIVRNLYEDTMEEEIKEAIQKETDMLHAEMAQIEVKILPKTNKQGLQTAMVTLRQDTANKLMSKGKIKVAWNVCKIEELYTPVKCYKCQKYGHFAANCKENTDLKGKCLKCMKEGHTAKDCKEQARCYECDVEGHQAGGMACPKYRKLVREWRKMEAQRGRS